MGLEVVKRMDAAELAAWRKGRTVDSAAGTTAPTGEPAAAGHVWKRDYVKPLSAAETFDAVFEQFWTNMTSDRDTFQAAIRWMRRRQPGLGHRTDDDLKDFLKDYVRDAVQTTLGPKGLLGMNTLDGMWV